MADLQRPIHGADLDVVVVGAGFAGLHLLYKLREMGFSVRVFETGDGVGGTWFWNRYPGARCDVESLQYSFGFSDELQQDWEWSERYSSQAEILAYLNHVADRFDLRKDIRFESRVSSAALDETTGLWRVETEKGEVVSARFCIMATGCLSAARLPEFPGLDSFEGRWFHTGRWPKEPVSFEGRRVAVIGTGSSGIQASSAIALQAGHLTVFQRTPNFSIPAWNAPLSAERQKEWKTNYKAFRRKARGTRSGALYDYSQRGAFDVDEAERQREFEARWAKGGANFTHAFNDIFLKKEANDAAADFVRGKIREIVKDPAIAEVLTPTDHPIGTKRICVDTDYYATFNRDNVSLVDLRKAPLEAITPTGLKTADAHYEVDDIVFATGYDAVTGALAQIDIRGRGNEALREKWVGGPKTYLGLMAVGFPNFFIITGPGSPSILSNVVVAIEQHVEWVLHCIDTMRRNGQSTIEPTLQAEDNWVAHVNEVANRTLFPLAKSWYMGANIPGKPRVFLPYVGGLQNYSQICEDVAAKGYEGFVVR